MITVNKVKATFIANDFYYKYARFLSIGGRLEVDFNKVRFVIGLGLSTQTLADGRVVPQVYGQDVQVQIDRSDMKIQLHGTLLANAINIITPFIKGTVASHVESALLDILNNRTPQTINDDVTVTDGFVHTDYVPTLWLDWETPSPAVVSEEAVSVSIKGVMYDTNFGMELPNVAIPELPNYDPEKPELC